MASSLMNYPEQYRQASLDFATVPEHATSEFAPPTRQCPVRPLSQPHTLTASNRRMPDDLWGEYRLECAFREEAGLPFVSLPEFEDMRDWADRVDEPRDAAWPTVPSELQEDLLNGSVPRYQRDDGYLHRGSIADTCDDDASLERA